MNLGDVMAELGARLETIEGLRVFPWYADKVVPPAASVGMPTVINWDQTYARGMDLLNIPVVVAVARITARGAHRELGLYLAGDGPKSIKYALENPTKGTSFDSCTVPQVSTGPGKIAGVDYLTAIYDTEIRGPGS